VTANPVELIGGYTTTGNVAKADVVAFSKARIPIVMADATEIRNTLLAGQLVVSLKANGFTYLQDTADTTTADDGVNCIISNDGKRFKIAVVTNAVRATMPAHTLKGNATGSTANEADIDVAALALKASPVSADIILIQDSAAGNALKKTTVGGLVVAGFPMRSYLAGLTLSTAGSSRTFGIAAGLATDSANTSMLSLASAYTKTTSAWALGTAVGALDTGTIANSTWYHAYLIQRPDTGVVDVLISLSATSPTLPTNYTLFRRIGSMKTDGSSPAAWIAFIQFGDSFFWSIHVVDVAGGTSISANTDTPVTLTVPPGLRVSPFINVGSSSAFNNGGITVRSPDLMPSVSQTDSSNGTETFWWILANGSSATRQTATLIDLWTNTSSQVVARTIISTSYNVVTLGWRDLRGKLD
jgi:hypothetical protein